MAILVSLWFIYFFITISISVNKFWKLFWLFIVLYVKTIKWQVLLSFTEIHYTIINYKPSYPYNLFLRYIYFGLWVMASKWFCWEHRKNWELLRLFSKTLLLIWCPIQGGNEQLCKLCCLYWTFFTLSQSTNCVYFGFSKSRGNKQKFIWNHSPSFLLLMKDKCMLLDHSCYNLNCYPSSLPLELN